jgi:hypothetical protein
MKIYNTALVLGLVGILAACTTTEDANQGLSMRYQGSSADNFFLAHGPPVSQYRLNSGKRLYIWSENPSVYRTPGTSNTTVNVIGNTAFATTRTTPGSTIVVQCQVKIQTSSKGIIEKIQAHGDTIGKWELSRCAEIFRIRKKKK